MNYNTLAFFILSLLSFACSTDKEPGIKVIDAAKFSKLIEDMEVQVVDVRTKGEVLRGSVPGALNLDISSPDFNQKINLLDPELPVVVYCAVGGRSAAAAKILQKNGFSEVYDFTTGYSSWKAYSEQAFN